MLTPAAQYDYTPRAWTPPIGTSRVLLFPQSRQSRTVTDGRYFPRKRMLYEGIVFEPGHQAIVWEVGERFDQELAEVAGRRVTGLSTDCSSTAH